MKKLFILLFFSSMLCTLRAQSWYGPDTSFWLGFIPHSQAHVGDNLLFSITSCDAGVVTISNPNTSWSDTVEVSAGETRNKEYNSTIGSMDPYGEVTNDAEFLNIIGTPINSGLCVSSTVPITLSVCTQRNSPGSIDACQIMPTSQLGSKYVIQSYEINTNVQRASCSNFCIVAVGSNGKNLIDVYLTANTSNGWSAGSHQTILVNPGECIHFQTSEDGGLQDFAGTVIQSQDGSKIAVFEGNRLAMVPISGASSDMMFNQSIPVHSWGSEFIAVPVTGHENAYVKVTASADTCQVYFDGVLKATLSSYESYTDQITSATYINTNKPASVAYYVDSRHSGGGMEFGDCAMTTLLPLSHHDENGAYFTTFQMEDGYQSRYYLNVVTPSNNTNQVMLDNQHVQNFSPVGSTGYSFAKVGISEGNHVLYTSPSSWFIAQVIGLSSNWEGYIHNIGGNRVCENPLAIKEESMIEPIITPNPTHDNIYVKCPIEIQSYELISIVGTKLVEGVGDGTEVLINVQNLSKGVYILHLKTYDGIITKKILIE